jgi:hypothetical protein
MKNVSGGVVNEIKTRILSSMYFLFFENLVFYGVMCIGIEDRTGYR